jgi:5-methylcytosine-specific restriction endonuclease McrA
MIKIGKLGIERRTGRHLDELRRDVFLRDNERCVICKTRVIWQAGFFDSMHLAHIRSRGAGGSDTPENVRTLCMRCHMLEHNPKSVPPKGK